MKYIYYSFFAFALLFGSCAQQEHLAKRKNPSANTIAAAKPVNNVQTVNP